MGQSGILALYESGLAALESVYSQKASTQVIGAASPRPISRKKVLVKKPAQGDHKTSVKNAQQIGSQAVAQGKRLLQQITQKSKRTKTVGKKLSTAQLKKIANNLITHGQKLLHQAAAHREIVQKTVAKQKAGAAAAKKVLTQTKSRPISSGRPDVPSAASTRATIRGDVEVWEQIIGDDPDNLRDYLVAYIEVLGDFVTPAPSALPPTPTDAITTTPSTAAPPSTPNPASPGLMMDGTVDPSFITGAIAQDPMVQYYQQELAAYPAQPTGPITPDPSTYTHDPNPTSPQTDATSYKLDSASNITDANGTAILKAFPYDDNPSLGRNSQASLASASKWSGGSGYYQFSSDGWQTHRPSWDKYYRWSGPNGSEKADFNAASVKNNWGPIIGNPNGPFKGLRFATDGSGDYTPFFFYDTAPVRFTAADQTTLLAQAVTDWQTNKTALEQQLSAAVVQAQLQQQQTDATTQQQTQAQTQADQQQQVYTQQESDQQAQIQQQSDATSQQEQTALQQAETQQQAQADQDQAQADAEANEYENEVAESEGLPPPNPPPGPPPPPPPDPNDNFTDKTFSFLEDITGDRQPTFLDRLRGRRTP